MSTRRPAIAGPGDEIWPLSPAQYWILMMSRRLQPEVFDLPRRIALVGEIDVEAMRDAYRSVALRHDALRTRLVRHLGLRMQAARTDPEPLIVNDLRHVSSSEIDAEITRWVASNDALRIGDGTTRLSAAGLALIDNDHSVLVLRTHHLVADWWSFDILLRDLAELYRANVDRRPASLPELRNTFAEVVQASSAHSSTGRGEASAKFWTDLLTGAEISPIRLSRQRRSQSARPLRSNQSMDAADAASFRDLAKQHQVSLFMLAAACFAVLLGRITGRRDVLVYSELAGRPSSAHHMVGCFATTAPLRFDLSVATFGELIRNTRAMCLNAIKHQNVDLARVVSAAGLDLFPRQPAELDGHVFFQWRPPSPSTSCPHPPPFAGDESTVASQPIPLPADLYWVMYEPGDGIAATLDYDGELFDVEAVDQLWRDFVGVARAAVSQRGVPLDQVMREA